MGKPKKTAGNPAPQAPTEPKLSIKQQYSNAVEALNKLKAVFYDESIKFANIKASLDQLKKAIEYQDKITKNLYDKKLADRKEKQPKK